MKKLTLLFLLLALITLAPALSAEESDGATTKTSKATLKPKLWTIGSTFLAGHMGLSLPSEPEGTHLGQYLQIDKILYPYMVVYKGFAAGVILATAFLHLLPDAYLKLTSPSLDKDSLWVQFPMLAFTVAMAAAVLTLTLDAVAQSYLGPRLDSLNRLRARAAAQEHKRAKDPESLLTQPLLIRRSLASASSKVLEVGIWGCNGISSVIIGFSLGVSESDDIVAVLIGPLVLYQTFKHTGVSTCFPRATKSMVTATIAVLYFCLTTPVGIVVGIETSRMYEKNSPSALVLQGIANAATAGILIYHSLVHMLVADFLIPKVKKSVKLQVGAYAAFLFGCCMFSLANSGL